MGLGTPHFSETKFEEPLATSTKDSIEQKVDFGPNVPNLFYTSSLLQ